MMLEPLSSGWAAQGGAAAVAAIPSGTFQAIPKLSRLFLCAEVLGMVGEERTCLQPPPFFAPLGQGVQTAPRNDTGRLTSVGLICTCDPRVCTRV